MTKPTDALENTDRELWREREGDYYANSIHVTKDGGIGINVGGSVIVRPLEQWFAAMHEARPPSATPSPDADLVERVAAVLLPWVGSPLDPKANATIAARAAIEALTATAPLAQGEGE